MTELVWRGSHLDTKLFVKIVVASTSGLGKCSHIPTQINVREYGWSQSCTHTLTLNVIQFIDNIR